MYRLIFLLFCSALSRAGFDSHNIIFTILSMVMYYCIGVSCIDYAKSDVYNRYSSLFKDCGIESPDDINIRFSFRDFLALLVGFSIGQLLFNLFNGNLISFILSLVPWELGLEMATWPHKRLEEYIGREKFLGFGWPLWPDASLELSTPWLTSNSSDEEWKGYALEVIERLKQHLGCKIELIGLRENNSGNASFYYIELSEYKEAEAEWIIKRFFTSFGDGEIEVLFYTSDGKPIENHQFPKEEHLLPNNSGN